ncbi:MAG: hypothetical protein ABMB14_34490 [Myxococcota bacterium]
MPTLLLLAACAAVAACADAPGADDPCRPGFVRGEDGHCWPPPPDPAPPTANDVLEALGPCVPFKPSDEIDLVGGCIEGACAGATFDTVSAALGSAVGPTDCEVIDGLWYCHWDQAIDVAFPLTDDDGPDAPIDGSRASFVRGTTRYAGATVDGLGVGISPRCWVDALGPASSAVFVDVLGTLAVSQIVWDAYGVEIEDEERADGAISPNGIVDELTLFGPP